MLSNNFYSEINVETSVKTHGKFILCKQQIYKQYGEKQIVVLSSNYYLFS